MATLPTPQFRRYGVADGLPSSTFYAVTQDKRGFMWFGSAAGLVRYDGVDFKVFKHDPSDPASMPDMEAYTLFVDKAGRVWMGGVSPGGLGLYDVASNRFRSWRHDDKDPASLAGYEVWSIAQTADGGIWAGTSDGLDRMRADGKGFEHIRAVAGEKLGTVRALLAEANGRLWIGTAHALYLREADGHLRRVPMETSRSGSEPAVSNISGAGDDIRVASSDGLLKVAADGMAHRVDPEHLSFVLSGSARDWQDRLWIGSRQGVYLDAGDGHVYRFQGQPLLPGGLPGDMVGQIAVDREGGLWFTLNDAGIAYLAPGWDGFARFTHIPDEPASLAGISAYAVQPSADDKLWVGGLDWIDQLDPADGHVRHVVRSVGGAVVSLAEEAQGRLWFVVAQSGLYRYREGAGAPIKVDTEKAHLSQPQQVLAVPGDSRIYIGSWGEGVFALDQATQKISPVPIAEPLAEGVLFLSQMSAWKGTLWYASGGGLLRMNPARTRLDFVPGVPRQSINAFAFDDRGFWLADADGLEHYRLQADRAVRDRRIDAEHGLPSSAITNLCVDANGLVWLFANPGLWRLDPATGAFTTFGPQDGLVNAEFNNYANLMLADGTIYAANLGGVVGFRPQRLGRIPAARVPAVMLRAVSVRRQGRLTELRMKGNQVNLGWRDRDLRVEARVASFVDPGANHYRFRLEGFDTDWIDVGAHGEREFAGLGAGDYTLVVKAAGADGVWGYLRTPLNIHIEAAPWSRWWAWLTYLLVLAALSWLALRVWRKRLSQRHAIQLAEQRSRLAEQASAAKTRFLATLGHEIRTPMTGVMGMAELLLKTPLSATQREYAEAMQGSGGLLLKLVNDALDLARIEAGRLELDAVAFDPAALLREVARLAAGQAQAKGLRVETRVSGGLPPAIVGDVVRVKQVLLNLVGNAVKFTDSGSVTLELNSRPGLLEFSVTDTGPGIPEASQARLFQRFEQVDGPQRHAGSGLGLAICRELVGAMGGHIELESQLGQGSTFRVSLPLPASVEPVATPVLPALQPAATSRSLRIILVEDDSIVAAVIRGLLESQGHTVDHVANGLAALADLSQLRFDAMLLDLDLPGVDGFQIVRLVRLREKNLGGQRLPVIAVTARAGGNEEARVFEAGMDGFLRKPMSGASLAVELAARVHAAEQLAAHP